MAVTAAKLNGGASSTATTTPSFTAQSAGVWLVLCVSADDYRLTTGSNRPESSGWTLQSSGQDEIGAYVWTKVSTGAESSVSYSIGSASPSSWQVVAVTGATGTLVNTPAATHTHGGSTTTSGSATASSGNGYALACFMGYHSSASITGGTFTNSYTSVGFQLGPTTGNREATQTAGLATTSAVSTSSVITWTGAAPFCSYGSLLIFQEASGGGDNTGTVSVSTPKLTASISGASVNAGTVSASTIRPTTSISGASVNTGTVAASTPVVTAAVSGASVNAGTMSAPVPRLTTSISDTTSVTGTLSASTPRPTTSIAGQSVNAGTVSASTIRLTSTVTGASTLSGTVSAPVPRLTSTIAGTAKLTGTLSARTPLLTMSVTDLPPGVPIPDVLGLYGVAPTMRLEGAWDYELRGVVPTLRLRGE